MDANSGDFVSCELLVFGKRTRRRLVRVPRRRQPISRHWRRLPSRSVLPINMERRVDPSLGDFRSCPDGPQLSHMKISSVAFVQLCPAAIHVHSLASGGSAYQGYEERAVQQWDPPAARHRNPRRKLAPNATQGSASHPSNVATPPSAEMSLQSPHVLLKPLYIRATANDWNVSSSRRPKRMISAASPNAEGRGQSY